MFPPMTNYKIQLVCAFCFSCLAIILHGSLTSLPTYLAEPLTTYVLSFQESLHNEDLEDKGSASFQSRRAELLTVQYNRNKVCLWAREQVCLKTITKDSGSTSLKFLFYNPTQAGII